MDGTGEILAAVDDGHILGTVTLVNWPHGGEVLRAPGEGEVRALAVASTARGRGIGRALLAAVMQRAAVREVRELLLLTQPDMLAAQHLYAEAGFRACRTATTSTPPATGCSPSACPCPGAEPGRQAWGVPLWL